MPSSIVHTHTHLFTINVSFDFFDNMQRLICIFFLIYTLKYSQVGSYLIHIVVNFIIINILQILI